MAEGGGDKNEENPFSFKKFVKKKSKDGGNQLEDGEDEDHPLSVDLLDVAGSSEVRDEDRRCRDVERDTNPFSFKKFLQPDNKSKPSTGPTSLKTLDLANDLPDFVQNHYSGSDSPRLRPPADVPLPDFALDSAVGTLSGIGPEADGFSGSPDDPLDQNPIHFNNSNSSHSAESRTNTQPAVVPDLNLDINDSAVSDSDYEGSDIAVCQANSAGGLPDFLPDFLPGAAVSGSGARPKVTHSAQINGHLQTGHFEDGTGACGSSCVHQLESENAELRRQLKEARDEAEQAKERLSAVMTDHDLLQVKDAEDTAALEKVIRQVEANLQTAMQRALTAEATNNQLRQEIKQLNKKVELLQEENAILRQDPFVQDHLREKTRYAASQLSAAAKTAEQHLRQLLSGVDTLKMVSEVLLSADKLSDIITEADNSEPQGAEGGF